MRLILTLVVLALVGGAVLSCFFVVDQTEFVIVKRFGDPVHTLVEPGLRVKWPWPIDTVVRFDNRLMVLENPAPDEPDKEYLTQDEQAGIGKNVVVTTYTCWRIKPDPRAVLTFLETMGDRVSAEDRLGDIVVSELGAALGRKDFSVLITTDEERRGWQQFVKEIGDRCRQRVEDEYGIEIMDIQLQRLNFPDQNRRNVFDRMRAERETIASRYRSEGTEQATTIRARADRESTKILAQAQEESKRIYGSADAEAARIYAEAYSQDPDFYEFWRTLQAYEQTFDERSVLVLSADSEFLRLLNRAGQSVSESVFKPESRTTEPVHAEPTATTQPGQS